jgi:signal peptidase II
VHDVQAARGEALTPDDPAPARRRVGVLAAVTLLALVADLVTKTVAVERLSSRDPVPVVDGVLTLRLVRNPGAAFGLAQGATVVFTVVALVVVLVILRAARRLRSRGWAVGFGLVLGGALGNLTDRLFRAPGPLRGHVVDFLELPHWPVFNLADSAIVTGGALIVVLSLRGVQYDGTRPGR